HGREDNRSSQKGEHNLNDQSHEEPGKDRPPRDTAHERRGWNMFGFNCFDFDFFVHKQRLVENGVCSITRVSSTKFSLRGPKRNAGLFPTRGRGKIPNVEKASKS